MTSYLVQSEIKLMTASFVMCNYNVVCSGGSGDEFDKSIVLIGVMLISR